jgi:hypothetical protein
MALISIFILGVKRLTLTQKTSLIHQHLLEAFPFVRLLEVSPVIDIQSFFKLLNFPEETSWNRKDRIDQNFRRYIFFIFFIRN